MRLTDLLRFKVVGCFRGYLRGFATKTSLSILYRIRVCMTSHFSLIKSLITISIHHLIDMACFSIPLIIISFEFWIHYSQSIMISMFILNERNLFQPITSHQQQDICKDLYQQQVISYFLFFIHYINVGTLINKSK